MNSKYLSPAVSLRFRRHAGFTLIELMVSLTLGAILLTVGVPSFRTTIQNNRLTTQANSFLGTLNLARSEAIKRGQPVTVCKANVSVSPPVCNTTACNSTSGANCWEQGWIVFSDSGPNEKPLTVLGQVDSNNNADICEVGVDTDCIIRVFPAAPTGMTIRVAGTNTANGLRFLSSGGVQGIKADGTTTLGNDSFRLCQGSDVGKSRRIAINNTGRAQVTTDNTTCP